ncbi:phospholipase/carboxylesterase [Flammeovirgaceae bacterium 311]|nr:phospholipase/carboxylesterase [Flammeovirgaceae bacterium 311]
MTHHTFRQSLFLIIIFCCFSCQPPAGAAQATPREKVVATLVAQLRQLAKKEQNPLLKRHFESLALMTLDTTHGFSMEEKDLQSVAEVLEFFKGDGKNWQTYLQKPRPLIMAYQSPADGKNSYYWLFLPRDFSSEKKDYPLYMELHGSGGGSNNPPWKMLYHYLKPEEAAGTAQMYRRDGFMIYPWGRGDKGYNGIAFTDIKESLADFDALFTTDPDRQYVYGFSMGGKGAYLMALETPDRWTALGIYSGIMKSTPEEVKKLKNLPVWMTWGETERWAENNRTLRDHLQQEGVNVRWEEQAGVGHSYKGDYQEALMKWFLSLKD